jgi:two-component system chemotaxis response regulator CheB
VEVVVVGASAGGVQALSAFVAGLSADLGAAVLVAHHFPAGSPSALADILDRAGRLPAGQAVDGEPLVAGRIYTDPAGCRLTVGPGTASVTPVSGVSHGDAPIDGLFRSAALAYGSAVIGVVLSGVLDDGAAGLAAIRRAGGRTVVQDPEDALYPDMPAEALRRVEADVVGPAAELGASVSDLVASSRG